MKNIILALAIVLATIGACNPPQSTTGGTSSDSTATNNNNNSNNSNSRDTSGSGSTQRDTSMHR